MGQGCPFSIAYVLACTWNGSRYYWGGQLEGVLGSASEANYYARTCM